MRMLFYFSFAILCSVVSHIAVAQSVNIEILTTGTKTSIRGLSVVNDNVVWVSGSNGVVGRSNSGGKNWSWFTVKGYEKTEFRDIEAFDANTAIDLQHQIDTFIKDDRNGYRKYITVISIDKL